MKIRKNVSLKNYNTFGIDTVARQFVEVQTVAGLQALLREWEGPAPFILGGGSNILLASEPQHLVVKNSIRGREVVSQAKNKAWVAAGGGENWHEFVLWCLEQGFGGIENLSLIPGTVGAAPIQNIGAYGVELQDVFYRLEAVELASGAIHAFDKAACRFGYRDSIFKGPAKGKYCITRVILELTAHDHDIHTEYGAIRRQLTEMGVAEPGIEDVSRAVIAIRSAKLPDPARLGNSGSFFKNPEVSEEQFRQLQERFPEIVHYPLPGGGQKIPAGWLIEQCGWKGKRIGDAGAYEKQALVLVNYGNASGRDILRLAERIMEDVKAKFGIQLQPEVNIL